MQRLTSPCNQHTIAKESKKNGNQGKFPGLPAWNFGEDMCSMAIATFIPLLDEHCTYEAIIAELLDVHEFRASVQVFRDRVIDVVCSIQFTGVHISICLCWGKYTSIII